MKIGINSSILAKICLRNDIVDVYKLIIIIII